MFGRVTEGNHHGCGTGVSIIGYCHNNNIVKTRDVTIISTDVLYNT